MLAILVLVEKCKVSQDGALEVCEGLVHSRGQHLPRGRVGVLGRGGVLKPTLDHNGDEREGSSAYASGGPATVSFLLREGEGADGRGWSGCRVLQGGLSRLHILGRGLFRRYGDGLLVRRQQNLRRTNITCVKPKRTG